MILELEVAPKLLSATFNCAKLGHTIFGLDFRLWGGFWVLPGSGFRVSGFTPRPRVEGFKVSFIDCKVQPLWALGFRTWPFADLRLVGV